MPSTTEIMHDQIARSVPSPAAITAARSRLAKNRAAEYAFVPMVWPGKERRIWNMGQQVVCLADKLHVATDDDDQRTAANLADAAAEKYLREQGVSGVYGHAWIDAAGDFAVFEVWSV